MKTRSAQEIFDERLHWEITKEDCIKMIETAQREALEAKVEIQNGLPKKICVSCEEEKSVHEICLDCAIKLGDENSTLLTTFKSELRDKIEAEIIKCSLGGSSVRRNPEDAKKLHYSQAYRIVLSLLNDKPTGK